MDVKLMHRQGASIREIARRTGLSRVTVRRILSQKAPKPYAPRPKRPSLLEPFVEWLSQALEARPWAKASVLYRELTEQGFAGHYHTARRWIAQQRQQQQARQRASVSFETGPGVEAQFDWKGPVQGLLQSDPTTKVWLFRFVLAYSRRRFTRAVITTTLPAVLLGLREVFELLGGAPHRLVFDNFKAAVLSPRPNLKLHPFFAEFCTYYGTEPAPALVYSPQRKGKVERSFLDVEHSEILRGSFCDLAALQAALDQDDEAHALRVVSTTGASPQERLSLERQYLIPLPETAFDPRPPETRRVMSDCTVSYQGSRYSVPYTLVGSVVTVKADPVSRTLEIFSRTERIANHPLLGPGQRRICEDHVAELRKPRWERARRQPPSVRSTPPVKAPELASLIPWPVVEVEQRPVSEYLAAIGGAL